MKMRYKRSLFQAFLITAWISVSHGCQMEGVATWFAPVTTTVLDTHSGSFFNRATTNIVGINSITFGEGLNSGPYVQVTHSDSVFDITTNDAYRDYEENETAQSMTFTIVFGCTGGTTGTLVFIIDVTDTNNNPPQFLPNDQFEFTITPPLPPGYQITGCLQDITVRDIDLTTQRIEFAIEPNEYFEIDFDPSLSTNPKEFKAILRTTTLIRTLSEPVELIISATDVDLTGDPPITTSATIRIVADDEFQLPEEPVFSRPYYLARYADNQVTLDEPITLQQGFDELVQFSLEGEHSRYFNLQSNGSELSIVVTEPLSPELLRERQLILAVRAEREFTSGATATVVVQIPEVLGLLFENTLYDGRIVDDTMEPLQLVLTQGFEDEFSVSVIGDFSAFFTTAVQSNTVILSLSSSPNLTEQTFISLQVSASNEFSTASTVVTLEVIRDDVITPAFEMTIYRGSYEPESGLTLVQIVLVQGYDETVTFSLDGEHASYFEVAHNGPVVSITAAPLPTLVLSERNVLLSLQAAKPRTVGANTAIYVELPSARDHGFESSTYIGTIEENSVVLTPIIMSVGYSDDINFSLTGDYATYFNVSHVQNQISIFQSTPLPQDVITSEDFLILTLSASGEFTETATTVVLLEIVKLDTNTPVFSQSIYVGSYSGMNLEVENISLVQGYDSSVLFRLDGEHAQYFDISNTDNNVIVTLNSVIPEELVFDEKVLLFDIMADKPLTVGANAVIAIRFPPELTELTVMKFAQNTYIGSVENNVISLESIILENGYNSGTEFTLTGAYASYFTFSSSENVITISILEAIPEEVMQTNRYIVLELEAERYQAVSAVTSILLDIVLPEVDQPIFGQPYYRGVYTEDSGLQIEQEIILTQGFDETVTFSLDGDSSEWFALSTSGNSVTLEVNGSIPSQIIESNHQLLFTIVASKVGALSGQTVISIELPKEIDPVIIRFGQNSYVGRIESGELQSPVMTLLGENIPELQLTISGEYANYFTLLRESNNVLLQINGTFPSEIEDSFIVLNIEATSTNAITGYTTVVLEIVQDPAIVRPMFERAYYIGEYSELDGLLFEHNMQLIEGFDESVSFTLEGDDAQWFEINYGENESLSLTLNYDETLPVADRAQLIFSIVAHNLNGSPGRATIVIILSDYPQTVSLQFSQIFYKGTIENDILTIEAISLDGYSAGTNLSIAGEYVNYFQLLNQNGSLSIELLSPLPGDVIDGNTVLILTLEARTSTTRSQATIVIEVQKNEVSSLLFEETYYVGSYSESSGFTFDSQISLSSGYEESVLFYLEGDEVQWFVANQSGNTVSLQMTAPIPQEVLLSRRQLIFVIVAEKPGSVPVRASIIIDILLNEITNDLTFLLFESRTYVGSIINNTPVLEPINLYIGYSENVEFLISGVLSEYFTVVNEGAVVSIRLEREIPDELQPTNGITLLELQASAPDAISGYTVVIFEFVQQEITNPLFSSIYYTGSYNPSDGLVFDDTITLSAGYDDNIEFDLQGEGTQWFGLHREGNNVSIIITNAIPSEVLEINQQIILVLNANKPGTTTARATVVIRLLNDNENWTMLRFERNSYLGSIQNDSIVLEQIRLSQGYTANVTFTLNGDESEYFELLSEEEAVTILLRNNMTEETVPTDRIILLELEASAPFAYSAYTTVVLAIVQEDDGTVTTQLLFREPYYSGSYSEATGLIFDSNFDLAEGYDATVEFDLEGDSSVWFGLNTSGNAASLLLISPIPPAVLLNNQQIIFTVTASKPEATTAIATVVVSLTDDFTEPALLGFNKISYLGWIENDQINLEQIVLSEGYTENVTFTLLGELTNLFSLNSDGEAVTITLSSSIPAESMPANGITILEIQASAPQSISAYATIVIEFVTNDTIFEDLVFSEVYYTGEYAESGGLAFDSLSLLQGYDENVTFSLEGDQSQWFSLQNSGNVVSLISSSPIPSAVLANNQQLIFIITADKPGSSTARATIIISLNDDYEVSESAVLGFNKVSYLGSIENEQVDLEPLILTEGYHENVSFTLYGELAHLFSLNFDGDAVTIALSSSIPVESIPANGIVVLEIQASAPQFISAYATIVIEFVTNDTIVEDLVFSEVYYTGEYTESGGLAFDSISLTQGYDENVSFSLEGDQSQWFSLQDSGNVVSLISSSPIPSAVLANNQQLIFIITADKLASSTARATIIISLSNDGVTPPGVSFERALYEGVVRTGLVLHEAITLSGYNGTEVQVLGTYAELFVARVSEGSVTVEGVSSVNLAPDVVYVALELRASVASTVLLLDVEHGDVDLPTVTFGSTSYSIRIDVTQTGFIGRVEAAASNGETVSYSLLTQDDNLRQRISVNQDGELHLSAPANSGVYSFEVVATTIFSSVSASAVGHLTVDVITVCGVDTVVPPLIILDRDEEEPHRNLVILNEDHGGCRYSLTSRWPANQTWLYVDDIGLHANAIDREDASIAFMALSQIQVELLLECDSDNINDTTRRNKRSVNPSTGFNSLGPYDYGDSSWILTDTILYNPRRSVVNLIVNDINDNYPIFIGKANEPIVVGYPVPELEERVSPRALFVLEATDADIGENAALVYWSSEEVLAVSPSTGLVHVRQNARLEDGASLFVFATDQNGQGLTGDLTLMVKLLDVTNIAVVTIRDAFLEDEIAILENLSIIVGYEVKALRATVISDVTITNENALRRKRDVTTYGALLQIYVYGLIDREPVHVDRLTADLNNDSITTVNITRTISLEDHLEIRDSSGRDAGLLVATIVLSVLLFILIVAAAVWFFLKWWKKRNYERFKDESSVASLDVLPGDDAKPQPEVIPRLNIDELIKSERRLQERLEAPDVTVEPSSSKRAPWLPPNTESAVTVQMPDTLVPIVIQDKLKVDRDESEDEDEYGETKNTKRKSVVTFNENVEKIIHVEETSDDESSIREVYKF